MNIEDIYTNQVMGRQTIGANLCSFSGSPTIQRDPIIMKLESDVFSRINNICHEECVSQQIVPVAEPPQLMFVSFEDALKELTSRGNN